MKVKLTAGQDIDFVSPDELRGILAEMRKDEIEGGATTWRATLNGSTNAAGTAKIDVLTVPLGRQFRLTRVVIIPDGFTPASPYTNAAGYVYVAREGGQVTDLFSLVSGQGSLPAVRTDSVASAAVFVNGEKVEIQIFGGPVSTNVVCYCQGVLEARRPLAVEPS